MADAVIEMDKKISINGKQILIRPIKHTDTVLESEFLARLSSEAKRFRFLGGVRQLSDQQLQKLCDVDYHESMAYVATVIENDNEREIGVARYATGDKTGSYELAVVIADGYRDTTLGQELVQHLIAYAKNHPIKKLYAVELNDNSFMRNLAHELGMSSQFDPDDTHQVIYSLALE